MGAVRALHDDGATQITASFESPRRRRWNDEVGEREFAETTKTRRRRTHGRHSNGRGNVENGQIDGRTPVSRNKTQTKITSFKSTPRLANIRWQ